MNRFLWLGIFLSVLVVVLWPAGDPVQAGQAGSYHLVEEWASFPSGVEFGPVASVAHTADGMMHVLRRGEPAFFTLDRNGKYLRSWGEAIFDWSHGLRVDRDGFIWATDGRAHEVMKFSPSGERLMTLGKRGVAGDTSDTFNRPTDVVVAPNGDFFVTDGYGNSRVLKFSKDGKFIKTWGTRGTGPGQFNLPHTIVMDSAGRLLVGDRENNRIQIFDQDGNFLDQWTGLGAPYGIYMAPDDTLFMVEGELDDLLIVDGKTGELRERIDGLELSHWVSMDPEGNVYVAEVHDGLSVKKFAPR